MHVTRSVVVAVLTLAGAVPAAVDDGDERVGWVTSDVTRAFADARFVNGTLTLPGPVPGPDGGDVTRESALANLTADAHLLYAADPDRPLPRVGVSTPAALRADLFFEGQDPDWPRDPREPDRSRVTRADVAAVLPEPEALWRTTLTGAQLGTLLEQQWRTDAHGGRPDLHLGLSGNVAYTYDLSRPRGDRVTTLRVDGAVVDPAARFRVAVPASLLEGPDALDVLAAGTDTEPVGRTDREALELSLGDPRGRDFADRAVGVRVVPDPVVAGAAMRVELSGFGLLSLGAVEDGTVSVALGGVGISEQVDVVRDGAPDAGEVTVEVPAGVPSGTRQLLVEGPSGTRVVLPVEVAGGRSATWTSLVGDSSHVYGSLDPLATARVEVAPAGVGGVVDFLVGDEVVATVPLVDGRARYRLSSTTPAGTYLVSARFRGDATWAPSAAEAVNLTVRPAVSGTTLTLRRPSSWLPAVWSADVRVSSGVQPVGRVELRDGATVLARTRVVRGLALGTVPSAVPRGRSVVAVFVPDEPGNVLGSRSAAVSVPR